MTSLTALVLGQLCEVSSEGGMAGTEGGSGRRPRAQGWGWEEPVLGPPSWLQGHTHPESVLLPYRQQ